MTEGRSDNLRYIRRVNTNTGYVSYTLRGTTNTNTGYVRCTQKGKTNT